MNALVYGDIYQGIREKCINLLKFTNQKFFIVEQFVEYECVCYGSTTTV